MTPAKDIEAGTVGRSGRDNALGTFYEDIEGKLWQKGRRQAEAFCDRGCGRRTADATVRRMVGGIVGIAMTVRMFDFAEDPLYTQRHGGNRTLTAPTVDTTEVSDQQGLEHGTAGAAMRITEDEGDWEDGRTGLRMDETNLRDVAMIEAVTMNSTKTSARPRWRPRMSGKTPSEAKSATGRRCCGRCGVLDHTNVARERTYALLLTGDTVGIKDVPMVASLIRAVISNTLIINRRKWPRRHRRYAALRRMLARKGAL